MWPTFTVFAQWKQSKSRDEKQRHQQEWLGPGETDRGSRIDSPIPSSKAHPTRFAAYLVPLWHSWNRGGSRPRPQNEKLLSSLIAEECHYCMLEMEEECLHLEPQFASVLGAWLFAACCWHPAPPVSTASTSIPHCILFTLKWRPLHYISIPQSEPSSRPSNI